MAKKYQAVFIDRDGTIGGTGHFIHPSNFTLFSFTLEAIELLKQNQLKVFAFTNQNRISRGQATTEEFERQFKEYGFEQSYICPHPKGNGCSCRKPLPGMLLRAAKEHNLDLNKCIVIGDVGSTDMLAAHAVNALKIIVKTGWGVDSLNTYRHSWAETEPDFIADNLLDATKWIIENDSNL
jgi:HAD superfamily hydrolase (TIGR01662 family)